MCGSHRRRYDRISERTEPAAATTGTGADPRTDLSADLRAGAELRAGDVERDRVGSVLGRAMAEGYLSTEEFDQRTDQALRARTRGQLGSLVADLPTALVAAEPTTVRPTPTGPAVLRRWSGFDPAARAHTLGYLGMVLVVLVIWTATAIAAGPYYFWPVWPILGGALGLVGHLRAGRSASTTPAVGR